MNGKVKHVPFELYGRVNELEVALRDVLELAYETPGGPDLDADPDDTSPEDMVQHIGGLIVRRIEAVLGEKP